jgi:hypothetical protein
MQRTDASRKLQASSFKLLSSVSLFFSVLTKVQSFLLFALMQKVEQKDQGKPQRSAGFARPAHNGYPKLVLAILCCPLRLSG